MKKFFLPLLALLISFHLFSQEDPKGLQVNENAPGFTAKDQSGNMISLEKQLEKGPVVLVFYRGQWCPHCNRQLKKLEDSMSLIKAKGAMVMAVSPEKPENIAKTIGKTKASYPVLFDDGLKIMKRYNVSYAVSEGTIKKYKGYGIDFVEANGEVNGANLPVPAMYIISKEGKIIFRHFDPDYSKRPSVAEILKYL